MTTVETYWPALPTIAPASAGEKNRVSKRFDYKARMTNKGTDLNTGRGKPKTPGRDNTGSCKSAASDVLIVEDSSLSSWLWQKV